MISFKRFSIVLLVLGASFALTACEASVGGDKIQASELEKQSSDVLTEEFGQKPKSVECPEDLDAEVDASEVCILVDQMNNEYDMTVTVTSVDDDGNAKFDIDVSDVKGKSTSS